MDEREISIKAAAELAGVTGRHLRRLVQAGTIRGHQVSGWMWVVNTADLQRWIQERERDQDARRQ